MGGDSEAQHKFRITEDMYVDRELVRRIGANVGSAVWTNVIKIRCVGKPVQRSYRRRRWTMRKSRTMLRFVLASFNTHACKKNYYHEVDTFANYLKLLLAREANPP